MVLGRRYAKALFEIGKAGGKLEEIEAGLNELDSVIASSQELQKTLSNPTTSRSELSAAIGDIVKKIKADKLIGQFCALLGENRRLSLLPDICASFSELAANARGEVQAEITVANKLDKADITRIGNELKEMTGKEVAVEEKLDEDILGGMIVKIGSQMLDDSLSGKLDRVKVYLKKAG